MIGLRGLVRSLSVLLPVLLCLALFSPVQATSTWNRIYGYKSGTAYSVIETPDAGYAIAGSSSRDKTLVVKTDSLGNMLWSKTYQDGEIRSIVATSDGGYALGGTIELGEYREFWLVKTDVNGTVEWEKTYARASSFQLLNMAITTSDGGYALLGYSWSSESSLFTWLVKTDTDGNMQWNKTYGAGDFQSMIATSDGGFALTGGDWLLKTDALGNTEWTQSYPSDDAHRIFPYCLITTSDGGYAIAGRNLNIIELRTDFWLLKTDEFGIVEAAAPTSNPTANPTQQPTSTPTATPTQQTPSTSTSTAPSPSPPIPELSWLAIIPLMLSLLSLALILRHRKQIKNP